MPKFNGPSPLEKKISDENKFAIEKVQKIQKQITITKILEEPKIVQNMSNNSIESDEPENEKIEISNKLHDLPDSILLT